jgi:uncharacterized membrane protein YfcA
MGTAPALLGSFLGVQANTVSPFIILVVMTTLLQVFLCIYSFRTYCKKKAEEDKKYLREISPELEEDIYRQEVESLAEKNSASTTQDTDSRVGSTTMLINDLGPIDNRETEIDFLTPDDPEVNQYRPTTKDLLIMGGMMLISPLMSIVRSNSKTPSWYQTASCTPADTVILISYVLLLTVFSTLLAKNILIRNRNKKLAKKDISLKEASYTLKFVLGVVGVSFVGGFLAAGSSTLLSIFMISLEIYAFIASSTTMVVAVIFSGSSTILYALNGLIYPSCVLIAGTVVVASTVITRMTLYQSFLKHGKASLILLFIAITMVVTVPANIYQVYPHLKEDFDAGKNILAFNSFCK